MNARLEGKLRQARLATADRRGRPHLVPVCFAWHRGVFYTAIDRKPKRGDFERLARVRNLRANPNVAVLIDEYREDWKRLWFILVPGRARLVKKGKAHRLAHRLLRRKYPQYRAGLLPADAPVIEIRPRRTVAWGKL